MASKPVLRSQANPQRNYSAMYKAAFEFQAALMPPFVDREYWAHHTPGVDEPPEGEADYWEAASDFLTQQAERFNGDSFYFRLLVIIYDEVEQEYTALRDMAAGQE